MRAVITIAIALLFATPYVALAQSTPDLLDVWLDKLRKAECHAITCELHFRHTDTNGLYSYACFQYQRKTFVAQSHKYHLIPRYPQADAQEQAAYEEEIETLIYDCDFQRKVARAMFENDPNAYRHWLHSVKGMYINGVWKPGIGCPPTSTTCQ